MSEPHTAGRSSLRVKPFPGRTVTVPMLLVLALVSGCHQTAGGNAAEALLSPRVLVFDDGMDMAAIQSRLDALHERQKLDEFSDEQWNDNGRPGFASYKVADSVQIHRARAWASTAFSRAKPR